MSISSRITSIEEHIKESYQELEGIGIDTTGVNKNLENIPKLIDGYWETLPKVTEEGTSITLDNTKEGKMKINLKGNTSQETSILPSGYTQVDYIANDTDYFDLGLKLTNNSKIEMKFCDVESSTTRNKMCFGARDGASSNNISINARENVFVDFNNSDYTTYRAEYTYTQNEIYVVSLSKEARIISNASGTILAQNTTLCTDTITTTENVCIGLMNPRPTNTWFIGHLNIYYCKIWENNVLVRNMVPCYRNSDSVVGLYDTVNNVFYEGIGEATVTYGAVATLPNPDYPQQVHIVTGNNSITISNSDNTQSKTYPINLGNIELCKIGTYQDSIVKDNGKWYLNKQIGKVVFDGSENWQEGSNTGRYNLNVDNTVFGSSTNNPVLSDRFQQRFEITNYSIFLSGSTHTISIMYQDIPWGYANFKTWLSNNNTIVYYALATPTYTEITDSTLLSQLEALNGAKSYTTQTNINQVNNDNASILNASALSE